MQQLSTGLRINGAKDDAAGLAIAAKMTSQIRGLDQAVRNANDGISLLQTADGSLTAVSDMLQRMREISVQASSDSNVSADRTALNNEFTQLRNEINRVASNTQWNGMNILDKSIASGTGALKFQVGANAGQTIELTLGNYQTNSASQGTTAVVATTANGTGPGHATPAAQVSTITIAGTPALGDVISVSVGDKSFVHKVTAGSNSSNRRRDCNSDTDRSWRSFGHNRGGHYPECRCHDFYCIEHCRGLQYFFHWYKSGRFAERCPDQ